MAKVPLGAETVRVTALVLAQLHYNLLNYN